MTMRSRRGFAWVHAAVAAIAVTLAVLAGCTGGGSSASCSNKKIDCGNGCTDTATDSQNCGGCGHACAAGQVCVGGGCQIACYNGTTACGSTCVNEQDDPMNCGGCGMACMGGEVCSQGKCALTCGGGTTLCNGKCKDFNSDPDNCGGCGNACAAGEMCNMGSCGLTCANGYTACNVTVQGGGGNDAGPKDASSDATLDSGKQDSGTPTKTQICVNLKTDVNNCGKCGFTCPSGEACVLGSCSVSCLKGETDCGGQCTNTGTDNNNCGGCGNQCQGGQVCSGGQCGVTCQNGLNTCTVNPCSDAGADGGDAGACDAGSYSVCSDPNTDPNNCGGCGTPCQQGYSCVQGFCQIVCPNGYSLCGMQCFDENNDINHCGDCFTQCFGSDICTQGICCAPNLINCGGQCTDITSDPNNCNGCGMVCGKSTPYCVNSACAQCPQGANYVNGHCVITYDINSPQMLDNLPYACSPSQYGSGGNYGFHWADVFPANTVPTAMSVTFYAGYNYYSQFGGAAARTVTLNGTQVYTYNEPADPSYLCTSLGTITFNVPKADLAMYSSGNNNAISIGGAVYDEGIAAVNSNYATVTVTF